MQQLLGRHFFSFFCCFENINSGHVGYPFSKSHIRTVALRVIHQSTYRISQLKSQPSFTSLFTLATKPAPCSFFLHTHTHHIPRHGRKRRHTTRNSSATAKAKLRLARNRVGGRALQPHSRKSTPPGLCRRHLPRSNLTPQLVLRYSTTTAKTRPTACCRCKYSRVCILKEIGQNHNKIKGRKNLNSEESAALFILFSSCASYVSYRFVSPSLQTSKAQFLFFRITSDSGKK